MWGLNQQWLPLALGQRTGHRRPALAKLQRLAPCVPDDVFQLVWHELFIAWYCSDRVKLHRLFDVDGENSFDDEVHVLSLGLLRDDLVLRQQDLVFEVLDNEVDCQWFCR